MRLMPIDVVVVLTTDDFTTHTFMPQERKIVSQHASQAFSLVEN